jgi:hypothetical protein
MADPYIIALHMGADVKRQKQLAQMQDHRNKIAAQSILRTAGVLALGVGINQAKGVTPYVITNALRGRGTVEMPTGHRLLPGLAPAIYTPVKPATPMAPSRRRRGRAHK